MAPPAYTPGEPPPPGFAPGYRPDPGAELTTAEQGTSEGRKAARADAADGNLRWAKMGGWGFRTAQGYQVVSLEDVLARDFGVTSYAVGADTGGCIPPVDEDYRRAKVDAYNEIMRPLIVKKHGAAVFDVAEVRAEKETEANRVAFEKKQHVPDDGNCATPYWYDAQGVKRYKPSCLGK